MQVSEGLAKLGPPQQDNQVENSQARAVKRACRLRIGRKKPVWPTITVTSVAGHHLDAVYVVL